jgi:hypothetical protein
MADATESEIWGDRAQSLLDAMGVMSSPIHMGTLSAFAMRKGWEHQTLAGVLAYCERQRLVERYRAFNSKSAFKVTGEAVPVAPVREIDPDVDDDVDAVEAAPVPACLCARTAPHVNYGCPEHGAARATTEENTDMTKDWISAEEVAKLLGCSKKTVLRLTTTLKHRGEGVRGKPFEFHRASVIAYRDERKRSTDLLPATPALRKATPKKSTAIVPSPAPLEGTIVDHPPADLSEVRALVRIVDRCGINKEAAWDWLKKLVA